MLDPVAQLGLLNQFLMGGPVAISPGLGQPGDPYYRPPSTIPLPLPDAGPSLAQRKLLWDLTKSNVGIALIIGIVFLLIGAKSSDRR